jgi:hypothetical protein
MYPPAIRFCIPSNHPIPSHAFIVPRSSV